MTLKQLKCKNCGAELKYNDKFCGKCGAGVERKLPEKTYELLCGKCGNRVTKSDRFCRNCGYLTDLAVKTEVPMLSGDATYKG